MITQTKITQLVKDTLKEDDVNKDITTTVLVPKNHMSKGVILAKEPAILCGIPFAKAAFKRIDKGLRVQVHHREGARLKKGDVIMTAKGRTRSILSGERTALNFLSYLSGIASSTNQYVSAIYPYKAKIYSTRKTTPSMRQLEKYAIIIGGGYKHRFNLSEKVLIKDNHHFIFREFLSISEAIKRFKQKTRKLIIVEVDSLSQLKEALIYPPYVILLDNMSPATLRKAVALTKKLPKNRRPLLEASGGITLRNVKKIAATGVDRISIGALTHTRKSINFSLELIS